MTKLHGFDERLLGELKQVVAQRATTPEAVPARRARFGWKPRVALVVAAVTLGAVAAVGAMLTPGHETTPAYAVSPQRDGTVRVEIRHLSDAEGLERKLAAVGIAAEVDYLPYGKHCRHPRYTEVDGRGLLGIESAGTGTGIAFTVDPANFTGHTLVLETSGDARVGVVKVGVAAGDVAPCVPVDAQPVPPAGGGSERGTDERGTSEGGRSR